MLAYFAAVRIAPASTSGVLDEAKAPHTRQWCDERSNRGQCT